MVILNEETESNLVSTKQEVLYCKLLQSSSFTKCERDAIVKVINSKIVTKYDASVLIDYLIFKIRYFKHFSGKRKHAIAKCFFCNERINLKRYLEVETGKKLWFCQFCANAQSPSVFVPVKQAESNEVKADLMRKYDNQELTSSQEDLICEHRER